MATNASSNAAAAPNNSGGGGKKAVHVKWAGKTIALGTFPAAEADEKCARAKALTRAWRSTMRPKPTRDWVMLELERLGVRVVSGRLGRKAGEEDDAEKKAAEMARGGPPIDRSNSIGWPSSDADFNSLMQQRRSSSIGLSMIGDDLERRRSLGSLGQVVLDGGDPGMPPHRPLVGGGAAAAYEAARADHYAQKNAEQQRRASSLGLGIGGGNLGGGMPQMGFSVNPNQHYEMLKLHHMNLLNEIQETTLMMNLYQQQQLQQQQQQLQQQASAEQMGGGDPQMALLLQQQQSAAAGAPGMDPMFGQQRGSLGLGATGSQNQQMEQLLRQQQIMQQGAGGGAVAAAAASSSAPASQVDILKGQQEQAALEDRLQKLKEDIARRQREADGLEAKAKAQGTDANGGGGDEKRKAEDEGDAPSSKKVKTEPPGDDEEKAEGGKDAS
ncbi:expressed unknown protein [Seminavis robusta]|uniref:Uncharacterized protein n=1 Tax=Seminavis robusta TaxID=568900 RepID=A0A9N8EGC9_9STRA|nr:expressed unknown protein [Seminavis robusta]|eukprot:Sro1157_g247360.1 n/a (442) ;mRNA; r:11010-13471